MAAEDRDGAVRKEPGLPVPKGRDWETRPGEWAVWQAVAARLSASIPPALLHGLTGTAILTTHVTWNRYDIEAMLPSGLAALGLKADLALLPDDDARALRRLLRAPARKGGLPVFSFQPEEAASLSAQALLTEVAPGTRGAFKIINAESMTETLPAETLRERFTHVLLLRREGAKGRRRANRHAALAHWAAFEAAFPERIVDVCDTDAPVRALAATFLNLCAGSRRDRASNLLRRAAALLAAPDDEEDINRAFELLREHLCLTLRLPHAQASAILAPPEQPLTGPQRSELIYLARAGTRDLKALAACRLTYERSHSDAERTLEQLLSDPDPLVRGAAQQRPSNS